jgi:hypothetical protein
MHPALALFARQFAGVVAATLAAVSAVAFLAIPLSLGGHPGEPAAPPLPVVQKLP